MKDKFNSNWPLDIAELTASDIMVLRNKVELINIEWPKQRIKDVILNLTHSSIPVMQGSHNNFIGVVKINVSTQLKKETMDTLKTYAANNEMYNEISYHEKMVEGLSKVFKNYLQQYTL